MTGNPIKKGSVVMIDFTKGKPYPVEHRFARLSLNRNFWQGRIGVITHLVGPVYWISGDGYMHNDVCICEDNLIVLE